MTCATVTGGAVCGGITGVLMTSPVHVICAIAYAIMKSNNPNTRAQPLVLFSVGTVVLSFAVGAILVGGLGAAASQIPDVPEE